MEKSPVIARIAILGAESSGKSTLCEALASHFNTVWVPEYLREFVETRQRVPFESDQAFIAGMQVERENAAARRATRFLFCDTAPLMTAIYSRFYWHRVDEAVASLAEHYPYSHTFVTAPDTPWEADGLMRESDEVRQYIHQQVLSQLNDRCIPFTIVGGPLDARLATVALALEKQ